MRWGSGAQGSKTEDQGQERRRSCQWMDWMKGRWTDSRSRKKYSQKERGPEVEWVATREKSGGWMLVCRAAGKAETCFCRQGPLRCPAGTSGGKAVPVFSMAPGR